MTEGHRWWQRPGDPRRELALADPLDSKISPIFGNVVLLNLQPPLSECISALHGVCALPDNLSFPFHWSTRHVLMALTLCPRLFLSHIVYFLIILMIKFDKKARAGAESAHNETCLNTDS